MNHNENTWYVFGVHPHDTELTSNHELLGKFFLDNGQHSVLEDHGAHIDGLSPEEFARRVQSLHRSSRRAIVSAEQLRQGHLPGALPTHVNPGQMPGGPLEEAVHPDVLNNAPKISEYKYHREGMPAAQHLKLHGHQMFLDDQPLSPDEIGQVMDNVQTGKATLRHHVPEAPVIKYETVIGEVLAKAAAEASTSSEVDGAAQSFLKDTMVPDVGNRAAYREFEPQAQDWVKVHISLLGFWKIRTELGHQAADHAIVAFNRAIVKAANEAVGSKNAKVFRFGGAETRVCVKNMEDTHLFLRMLRTKLEALPALRGVYFFAAAVGVAKQDQVAEYSRQGAEATAAGQWGQQQTSIAIAEEPGTTL